MKHFWYLVLLLPNLANSQVVDTLSEIDEIEIITKYKPILVEADKIKILPELSSEKIDLPTLEYNLPDILPKIRNNYRPIKPVSLKKEKQDPLYGNYAKLGFGNYRSPFAEFHLHNLEDNKYSYGLGLLHHSARGGNTGVLKNARYSNNNFNIYGEKFTRKGVLNTKFNYERKGITRYGYQMDSSELNIEDLKRTFNLSELQVGYSSISEKNKNGFVLSSALSSFGNDSASEFDLALDGGIKWSGRNLRFDWLSQLDITQYSKDTFSLNRLFVHTFPKITFKKKLLTLSLGAKVCIPTGDDTTSENLYVNPYAFVDYQLAPDILHIFGEIDGGLIKNDFEGLAKINPFLNQNFSLKNTFNAFDFRAGAKGSLNNFSYSGNLYVNVQNNRVLFISDSTAFRGFDVLYDDITQSGFVAQIGYTFRQKGFVNAQLSLNDFKLEKYADAFHLPNTEFELHGRYIWNKKMILKADGLFWGERTNSNSSDLDKINILPAFFDLSIGLEYLHKKTLAFFLEGNNILNNKYQFWANHPRFGINVMGGVSISI